MKHFTKRSASLFLTAAMLGSVTLVSGCQSTESGKNPPPSSVIPASSSTVSSAPQSTSSSPMSSAPSSTASVTSSSTASTKPAQSEPHFSFSSHDGELPIPTGESVRICSLSEAMQSFNEIAEKPVGGSPEDIVKTLMERNILCFAAVQGKCWTTEDGALPVYRSPENGETVLPIVSSYITSVEQMEKLFSDTYTEDQSYRLMHPQEAGGWGDVFQLNEENKLCFDLNHLRSNNGESFSTDTYIAVVEANDEEITFGRYYSSTPNGGSEPNVQLFSAVKENGEWRLDTYITDARPFVQQYSELITTGRIGAPELMELCKEQVGNIGGKKFWGWYGFPKHMEWCAAFVSWAYAQAGKDEPRFTGVYWGAEWFKEREQWGDADYKDIAPGDCIFFDWNLDGDADHVGLVIGTDGANVYTVEGNRDDICISRGYSRENYKWILGYGLMDWQTEDSP